MRYTANVIGLATAFAFAPAMRCTVRTQSECQIKLLTSRMFLNNIALKVASNQAVIGSPAMVSNLYFHLKTTGSSFTSVKYSSIRAFIGVRPWRETTS
jgi:hypothetical protein